MKIFRTAQIKELDKYTIMHEPIAPVDLMERAVQKLYNWFISRNFIYSEVIVVAGNGNNGGDGLALARMLALSNYKCEVWNICTGNNHSDEWNVNMKRLSLETDVHVITVNNITEIPVIPENCIIIDALFGSGLSKPVKGFASEVIKKINLSNSKVISIDIPSGLAGEDNANYDPESIIQADFTLTFQFPKLAFLFPENEKYTGKWELLDIGLHKEGIEKIDSSFYYLEADEIAEKISARARFSHKGLFGHGLFIGGSKGKMGAVILGSKASLRTGAGLISCFIPEGGNNILQTSVPELMTICDKETGHIGSVIETDPFDAVAIGPGIGTNQDTQQTVLNFITECRKPMVIDADALNILSEHKDYLKKLPSKVILTPHLKEFERIAGRSFSGYDRLLSQIDMAKNLQCTIVLKGANSSVVSPEGIVVFNSTGNPGMATAGSGDVLTGMILALLAQGYSTFDAACIGVYLHGLAGDLASDNTSEFSLIASDIIDYIGMAFKKLKQVKENIQN